MRGHDGEPNKEIPGVPSECGHEIRVSNDYYSGEIAQCDECGRWAEIPIGFYNWIPIQYYGRIATLTVVSLGALFLFRGNAFGNPPWWVVLILLPWLALTMWYPSSVVIELMARLVKSSTAIPTAISGILVIAGRRGLRAFIGVTDIGLYLPVVVYGLLAAAYIGKYSGRVGLSPWIRNPWVFMVAGAVLATLLTAGAAALGSSSRLPG